MPVYLILAVALLAVVFIVLGLRGQKNTSPAIADRLSSFAERPLSTEEQRAELSFSQRVLKPALRRAAVRLGERSPSRSLEKIQAKLAAAGNPSGLGAVEFIGLRWLVALGLGGGILLLTTVSGMPRLTGLALALVCALFGFILPNIWLDRKAKARRKEIMKALPDAIDLLTISVESGLGFDPAMMRVAEKWDNALTSEFARVLSEMRIGKTKREALREMANRVDEDGLSTFVSSVIQADQLGVPITQVLRIQSEAMRLRRRQRAEEAAQKAPLKMLFPMAFLIFPALYVVILGPAIPRLVESMGG
jgi:tight adherence protein C